MARLFVCAWPPPDVCDDLAALPRPRTRGVRWVGDANWHVTLRFLGDVTDAFTDAVVERLGAATLPRARLELGPAVGLLGGGRHLMIPVTGADGLARTVSAATAGVGIADPRPFRGHITLARVGRGVTPPPAGTPFSGAFDVAEVALVASDLRPSGAIYSTVAVFPTT